MFGNACDAAEHLEVVWLVAEDLGRHVPVAARLPRQLKLGLQVVA
jgi:hypothetical protein